MACFDVSMRRPFTRHNQLKDAARHGRNGKRRRLDRHEGVQKYRAIVVGVFEGRSVGRVRAPVVERPMCMNLASTMMVGLVVIRVRVDERSAEGRSLDGQQEREGNHFPHDVAIVVDYAHRVKDAWSQEVATPAGGG
jgi:hypothetical protein